MAGQLTMTAARGLSTDAFGRIRADIDAILDALKQLGQAEHVKGAIR